MHISAVGTGVVAHVTADLAGGDRRELQRLVDDALARGARDVVVDLAGAASLDPAAVGLLLMLARRTRDGGGRFAVANPNDTVRTLLEITRLHAMLGFTAREAAQAN
jgi:anti-anti-sigma factor